jgi:hypothetical protein
MEKIGRNQTEDGQVYWAKGRKERKILSQAQDDKDRGVLQGEGKTEEKA